jgi:hypothetical protein
MSASRFSSVFLPFFFPFFFFARYAEPRPNAIDTITAFGSESQALSHELTSD